MASESQDLVRWFQVLERMVLLLLFRDELLDQTNLSRLRNAQEWHLRGGQWLGARIQPAFEIPRLAEPMHLSPRFLWADSVKLVSDKTRLEALVQRLRDDWDETWHDTMPLSGQRLTVTTETILLAGHLFDKGNKAFAEADILIDKGNKAFADAELRMRQRTDDLEDIRQEVCRTQAERRASMSKTYRCRSRSPPGGRLSV